MPKSTSTRGGLSLVVRLPAGGSGHATPPKPPSRTSPVTPSQVQQVRRFWSSLHPCPFLGSRSRAGAVSLPGLCASLVLAFSSSVGGFLPQPWTRRIRATVSVDWTGAACSFPAFTSRVERGTARLIARLETLSDLSPCLDRFGAVRSILANRLWPPPACRVPRASPSGILRSSRYPR